MFTIDQFNVAQALASYAKFDLQFASASPNDPGLRALRQSMVHWHTFPTTFEDVNKEFGFLGYIAGGKKEDDEGAELLERDGLHRYRIQMYGEINNTPRFWSNASLAVGSKVGFMLKQVPLRVLNVPQIPRNAIDRNPTLGAMKVLQWVPWDSHVSGRFPPSNVDQLMFSQFAADTPETQEVMFKSNDVDHPLFGVPSVIGTRYQHGIVLTVGIVLRLNQLTSETAVKKALLTYEGVAELMRSNAKVDLVLDPAPAIGY